MTGFLVFLAENSVFFLQLEVGICWSEQLS